MSEELVTDTTAPEIAESTVVADQNAETATAKPETEEKPKPDPIQRRIDKLTREKYQLRGELEAMRRERESWNQQPTNQPLPTKAGMPKLEDFSNFDEYIAAKAEFIAESKLSKAFEEREQKQREREAQESHKKRLETWQERIDAFRATASDFEEVLESAEVSLTESMANAIMESEMGPQLAYYLARNPEEAEKLTSLSPSALNRAIGRIESKIENEQLAKKQSTAPKPVSPVGGRATGAGNPENMSDADWLKARRAQKR